MSTLSDRCNKAFWKMEIFWCGDTLVIQYLLIYGGLRSAEGRLCFFSFIFTLQVNQCRRLVVVAAHPEVQDPAGVDLWLCSARCGRRVLEHLP